MKYHVAPWAHQLEAIETAKNRDAFALFFEQGCLASSAEIKIRRNGALRRYTIEQAFRLFNCVELNNRQAGWHGVTEVRSWNGKYIQPHRIRKIIRSGVKPVFQLSIAMQKPLKLTGDHEVLTNRGWVPVHSLVAGEDSVATDGLVKWQKKAYQKKKIKKVYKVCGMGTYHPFATKRVSRAGTPVAAMERHRAIYEANLNGLTFAEFRAATDRPNSLLFVDPKIFHIHHRDHNHLNNDRSNLEMLTAKEHLRLHGPGYKNFGHGNIAYRKVKEVVFVGDEMTYDIVCDDPHRNFVANNLVVHNCGKTSTVINILRHKAEQNNGLIPSTLILCPSIVVANWQRELAVHFPELHGSDVHCLTGTGFRRLCDFERFIEVKPRRIVITNYEALYMKLYDKFLKWKPDCVILDESHKCKDISSKRTKKVIALGDTARFRYILTGTPILNGPMDIYSQFRFLDKGETFGDNYFAFRTTYFVDHNAHRPKQTYFPDWQPRETANKEINQKIYTKAIRVLKKDCLDLPPFVRQVVEVELTGEQLTVYKAMESDCVATFRNETISADLAIKKALRLQQIVTGYVTNDDGKNQIFPDNQRLKALEQLIESIGPDHKIIVWACFKQNYADIRGLLEARRVEYVQLTGDVPADLRQANVDLFCKGSARVLIANPASAGIGINLVESDYSIYYSRNFSLENDLQSEARNYRGGSERHRSVTRIDIVTKDTIDVQVLEALKNKQDVSEAILRKLKR